jgi:2,3-bisphosphoglycerate-dependent phosphoglycerate mutase
MQLYFIRHGQSINNANWEAAGYTESPDPWLTEIGKQQAQTLADYLEKNQPLAEHKDWNADNRHGYGITHIYSSLMERAAHTASFTARRLPGIPCAAWMEIYEAGGIYGREGELKHKGLPGKTRAWFEEHFPELALPDQLDGAGWWQERPYETVDGVHQRAKSVWADLLSRHRDQDGQPEHRVALVSHGEFFVHLMCAMLDIPFRAASHGLKSWFLLNNCSISRIDVRGEDVIVCYLNRTDHLPGHLLTG